MDEALVNDIYHQNTFDNAESLLRRIFLSVSTSLNEFNELSIMVIGAGTFPSFYSLVNVIMGISPNIRKLNFNLIDPDTAATNHFKEYFKSIIPFVKNLDIKIVVNNMDLKKYLPNSTNESYDLIYFERPDSSIFNMLFTHLDFPSSKLAISMHESIPFLRKISKTNTIFIGSFVYKDDLSHLKNLFKYSLNMQTKTIRQKMFPTRVYYNFGLIGAIDKSNLPNKIPEKLSANIKLARLYFYFFFLSSIVLFLLAPIELKTISFYFVILQLFYHRYGAKGILVRSIFMVGQLLLLLNLNTL